MNLADLTTRLAVPGLPEWSGLVVLLLLLLMVVAFLAMPFSVFGVKSRLDALEVQLDEIQAEIRSLALRLPEPAAPRRMTVSDDHWEPPPALQRGKPVRATTAPCARRHRFRRRPPGRNRGVSRGGRSRGWVNPAVSLDGAIWPRFPARQDASALCFAQ
ncbi:hypothetical protein ACE7GA_15930 [Roseomonas sp. CCTCC AB2023176]|uniref:hypothetical protein n=1 Tax=Roseomonas sp. CCTCC AB2023176 TaxID=3342640 RepID=UPI0035E387F9